MSPSSLLDLRAGLGGFLPARRSFVIASLTCSWMLASTTMIPACTASVDEPGSTGDDDDVGDDDDDVGDDDDDGEASPWGAACESDVRVGGFELLLSGNETTVAGRIANGVVPSSIQHEQAVDGECRLLQRFIPSCDPPCSFGETCHPDLGCIPEPLPQNLGTVSVDGLAIDVAMEPLATNQYFNTMLPHPAFEPGAAIRLHATGSELPAFEVRGRGIDYLEPFSEEIVLLRGRPLTVTWPPGTASNDHIAVEFRLNIDQHGSSPATIVCTTADTGTFDIPAGLIDTMFDLGISGFPSLVTTRHSVDSTMFDVGCADFIVASRQVTNVSVDGHIPCEDDDDCPPDMSCNLATQTCE